MSPLCLNYTTLFKLPQCASNPFLPMWHCILSHVVGTLPHVVVNNNHHISLSILNPKCYHYVSFFKTKCYFSMNDRQYYNSKFERLTTNVCIGKLSLVWIPIFKESMCGAFSYPPKIPSTFILPHFKITIAEVSITEL